MPLSDLPDHAALLDEVKAVRRAGIVRLRELELPALIRACDALSAHERQMPSAAVERLLRLACSRLDTGTLRQAAELTLGLAPGTRDWVAAERRRKAAELYHVSVERFRKHQEAIVLGQVAEQIGQITIRGAGAGSGSAASDGGFVASGSDSGPGVASSGGDVADAAAAAAAVAAVVAAPATAAFDASSHEPSDAPCVAPSDVPLDAPSDAPSGVRAGFAPLLPFLPVVLAHRTLWVPRTGASAGGAATGPGDRVRVMVHVHPVDLLRDVDVVVSPSNTHYALPEIYKSSVAASIRRAGAIRNVSGDLLEDRIHDELREWCARHGSPGRPVLPGTVAATGSGALAQQGVRRVYHAAVAVPRPGTNDYDVQPADVTRAVTRAFALLTEERGLFDPPLRSVCLPLLGSGRGGLSHEASVSAIWGAVEAELARGADWELHVVVRHPARADLLEGLARVLWKVNRRDR